MTFLADNGKPHCFDADDLYDGSDEFCEGCPIEYQADMLAARRCFPPDPLVTPVRQLMDLLADDALMVRAILSAHRVGFLSDKLIPGYLR